MSIPVGNYLISLLTTFLCFIFLNVEQSPPSPPKKRTGAKFRQLCTKTLETRGGAKILFPLGNRKCRADGVDIIQSSAIL